MKNAKHTEGPWSSPQNKSQYSNVRDLHDANGVRFAHIQFGAPGRELGDAEIEANARLIAAAPELLSALQQAIAWMDGERTAIDALANARAIIAKATTASAGVNRKTMTDEFTIGVVYSAAQIIQAYDLPVVAESLLNTVAKPTDDLTGCAEYDLAILRENLPAWANVPAGE